MSVKRIRSTVIGLTAFAMLCGLGLVCCSRSSAPSVSPTPARVEDGSRTEPSAAAEPPAEQQDEGGKTVEQAPQAQVEQQPTIDMSVPEEPEPATPRYVSVVEEIDSEQPSGVHATIASPTKLVLDTDNVKRLRVTREGVPLSRSRSIVLQIDGQGIEWTPKYLAVELERSPAGEWTVVRRRPAEP